MIIWDLEISEQREFSKLIKKKQTTSENLKKNSS